MFLLTTHAQVAAPDGGYGWIIVVTAFINIVLFWGQVLSFSVLYPHVTSSFDASYAAAGWVGSLAIAVAFMSGELEQFLVVNSCGVRRVLCT